MAITWRTSTRGDVGSTTPFSVTEPSGSVQNDILILTVYSYNAATYADCNTPTGWTLVNTQRWFAGSDYNEVRIFWIRRGASAPSLSITRSFSVYSEWSVDCAVGVRTTGNPYSAQTQTTPASRAAPNPGSVTTAAGETVWCLGYSESSAGGGGWTAPSGYTLRNPGAVSYNMATASKDISSGSSEDPGAFSGPTASATCAEATWSLVAAGGGSAALAGAPAAVATATGAITTKVAASGASLSVSTASGTISTAIRLAGPVSVISTPAAATTTKIAGAGLSAAVSTPSASLTAVINVAGGSLSQTVVSAAISTILRVIGNSAASVTATGQLTAPVSLAGLSPAEAKAWATLSAYGPASADGQIAADRQTTGITTETDGYLGAVFPVVVAGDAAASATATGVLINWSSFTLGWSAVAGATGYRIKVGTSSGIYDPARQVDVGPTILTYAIGGLFPGVTYYFTIVALDSGGNEGVAAPEISGIGDPPGAPLVLTGAIISAAVATATLNTEIKLAGTAQALATVVAALNDASASLSGNISAQALAAANLSTKIATSGSVIDVTTVTGALNSASAALAGFVSAQTTLGGDIEITVDVAGDSGAISSMTGSLLSVIAADGHSIADVTITGDLSGGSPVVIEEHPSGGWGHYGEQKKRKKPKEYLPTKDEVNAERIKLGIIPDEKQIKAEKQKEIVSRLSMTRKQIKESNAAFLASVSQAENTEMASLLWKAVISDEEAIASIIAELI